MIFAPATPEKLLEWRHIHSKFKAKLSPNRKSGSEVLEYIKNKYVLEKLYEEKYLELVTGNILENEFHKQKLNENRPNPRAFLLKNEGNGKTIYDNQEAIWKNCPIFIGVDLESGFYIVEGSCFLYDELYAFQGIDRYDIENCVRVADYIECIKKFNNDMYLSLL
ncbi:MAG: hypothetical protein IJN15_00870 [Clostridia bacterium]|nr:hypothetical protein [Clostridia bacterium]